MILGFLIISLKKLHSLQSTYFMQKIFCWPVADPQIDPFCFVWYIQSDHRRIPILPRATSWPENHGYQLWSTVCNTDPLSGNPPVSWGFPHKGLVMRGFNFLIHVFMNKLLNRHSTVFGDLDAITSMWRHCKQCIAWQGVKMSLLQFYIMTWKLKVQQIAWAVAE